jgi:hypothetical protein
LNIKAFIEGSIAGVIGDYVLFVMIGSFSKTTSEWVTYGWELFIAYNAAILFWKKCFGKREVR